MTPLKTSRSIRVMAILILLIGMIFMLFDRVLNALLGLANDTVAMALARYSNSTGQIALSLFSEDKKLLQTVNDLNALLPLGATAVTILFVVAIVVMVVGVLIFAFPKQVSHLLIALRILKRDSRYVLKGEDCSEEKPEQDEEIKHISLKKPLIIVGVLAVLLIIILSVRSCNETVAKVNAEAAVSEMQEQALNYIQKQKEYFGKKSAIGGPKSLQLPDSVDTDHWTYKVTGSRFLATSKDILGNCPAGSTWKITSSTKGFFTLDLVLGRIAPKDTACSNLTPDFSKLGRPQKKKQ